MTVKARDLPSIAEVRREQAYRCKASFAYFLKHAWHVIEPARPLIWGIHTEAAAIHLQAVGDGELHKLVANIAPGFGKSSMFSVAFPAWIWTRNPYERFLCASYSLDLSIRDNRNCRMLIESEWYQALFGEVFAMASDQNQKSYWENDKRGYRLATATRASGTGKRGTCLIIDDPNNGMAGKAEVEATVEWFGKTWSSRLNDQEKGSMIVVGQRLYSNDLTGHLLALGGWEHLNLPTEYEPRRKCYTSIGWEDPRTREGELLCPDLLPAPALAKLKQSLGSMNYAAQYQQAPVPSEGGKFKEGWFRAYSETDEGYVLHRANETKTFLKSACWRFGTIDLAISKKESADYTVMAVWAVTPENDLLLVHVSRDRLSDAEQITLLKSLHGRFRPDYWKTETVAYQQAFLQQALRTGIPCRAYKPDVDKERRASTAAVWLENEKTFWPQRASWLDDWMTELLRFPKGEYDDMVDNFSMAALEICAGLTPLSGEPDPEPPPPVPTIGEIMKSDPFDWLEAHGGWHD